MKTIRSSTVQRGVGFRSISPVSFAVMVLVLLLFSRANVCAAVPQNEGVDLALTTAEKSWISNHPKILLGIDPQFAPFEFIDDTGRYVGIAADYIDLLNRRLGINMEIVPGLTWDEAVEKAKRREIDVLPCVGMTDERKEYLLYSESYIGFPRVIISRLDAPFISGVADIYDRKVAIQKNSSHHGYLKTETTIEPLLYETAEEALIAVSLGSADVNIGNMAAAAYLIQKNNLSNLKIAAPVSNQINSLYFAIRDDWPEFVSIINKGLASLTIEEKNAIHRKWTTVRFEHGIDVTFIIKVAAQAGGVVIVIFGVILLWNRRLKKAQKNEYEAREKAEKTMVELSNTLEELKTTQDQLVQSEKLAALGQLIANIAHEINTPLGAIQSIVDSVTDSLTEFTKEFPRLEKELSEKELDLFLNLTTAPQLKNDTFSTRTRRRLNKAIVERFKADGCTKFTADTLILFDFSYKPDIFQPLIAHPKQDFIFKMARNLYNLRAGLETIDVSTQKATKVVFALKNFARFDQAEEKKPADIQSSLETVITLYDNQIKQNIVLKTDFEKLDPIPCFIDELTQVWTNLIHNALQAMDNQGTLGVSLKKNNEFVEVRIEDSGSGIPEEIQNKIFEPFFTTRKTGEGSGLGLDIVRKIVEKHSGTISFTTEQNTGTTFVVSIPINDSNGG